MASSAMCFGFSVAQWRDKQLESVFLSSGLQHKSLQVDDDTTIACWCKSPEAQTQAELDKPALVLIHGFGTNALWQWNQQVKPLQKKFRIFVPDLIFFGKSTTRGRNRSEIFQAQMIAKAMESMKVPSYSIVGTSYGGFVAFRLAHLFPERVEKVVIANSGVCKTSEDDRELQERAKIEAIPDLLLPRSSAVFRTLSSLSIHNFSTFLPSFVLQSIVEDTSSLDFVKRDSIVSYKMQQEGIPGTAPTFVSSLKACSCMGDVEAGKEVHVSIAKQGLESDTLVGNIFVDMYARCGSLANAEDGFKRLASRDVISWTALIQGYADKDLSNEAINYFELMQEEGISPDAVTFSCSLQACSSIGAIDRGQAMHNDMVKQGLEEDTLAGNGLVYMYAKLGLLAEAQAAFDKLLARDVGSWNTLIQGYAEQGLAEEAMNFIRQMQLEGLSPDVFTWSAVMAGYFGHEVTDKVFKIFAEMQEHGVVPNEVIFANVLMSCGNTTVLQSGRRFHSQIIRASSLEATDVNLATNLIDMYGKCGSMEDAQQVFDMMPRKDLVAWNTLITGYARQGKSSIVFRLYNLLIEEGLEPNEITCLSLLSACQHAGLVDKGQNFFESMRKELGIEPTMKHYACTFDLLGRAGGLNEILTLMQEMPFQPNLVTWRTIISACQRYGDVELGRQAFECAASLGEKYVFMSNIYADADAEELDTGYDVEAGSRIGILKLDPSG